jgi:fluoroquinolone transport system permease protein
MNAISALGRGDVKNIQRDSMMLFLLAYPLLLGFLLRWLIPFVTEGLQGTFDLTPYFLLLNSFFGLLLMAQLAGTLIGFLLLDERDQNTLTALMVTPLPVQTYAAYRALVPALLSVLGIFIIVPLIGVAVLPFDKLLPIAISTALLSPIYALLLSGLARNKVEGLAVMKGMGILMIGPFAAWWAPEPWQWLIGIFPTYWPVKAYWLAAAGESYLWVAAVGFFYSLAIIIVLYRRFQDNMYRT